MINDCRSEVSHLREFQRMCLEDEGDCARVESVVNGCRSEVSNLRIQQM